MVKGVVLILGVVCFTFCGCKMINYQRKLKR